MTPEEAYRILELEPGATPEQVQEAYRKAAVRTHPDKAEGYGLHDRKAWLKVRDAYEYLRAAGFPAPAPPKPSAPAEPKRYRAPEWLEQKWANDSGERLGEHFKLDDNERRALGNTVFWFFAVVAAGFLLFFACRRLRKPIAITPRPGWVIRLTDR